VYCTSINITEILINIKNNISIYNNNTNNSGNNNTNNSGTIISITIVLVRKE